MKRGSHGDYFLKLIERIRATIPGVGIRSSFIVGFPGETAADFDELCEFLKAAKLDRVGVFKYSDEDTSASYALDQKVDGRTIHNRRQRLMAVQRRISAAMNRKLVGREFTLLVEGPSPETDLLWEGRLPTQAPEIDGVCYINDFGPSGEAPMPGQFRRFRVTEATDYDLIGELLDTGVKTTLPPANPFPILNIATSRPTAQHI